ncbi:glycosyl transferase family 28 [Luteococcus japonicus]|uniref:Glycosyl transferase family 28 n=1 Tax=Luteococcus japonicus TaxID=33984 RepID=A0A3N1ZPV6_9ACTN|nr:glycosyltransferase [Luteococcus japonicus]ROR52945.1 glycosyl transferase family 28 [Luteococcus japonicus]
MTARFCLISIGSRGDVAPFIAVGQALRGAGHEGVLVVLEPWRDLVEAAGLDCQSVPLGDEALWPHSPVLRDAMIAQPGLMWAGMRHHAARSAPVVVDTLCAATVGADAIVSGGITRQMGHTLARRRSLTRN